MRRIPTRNAGIGARRARRDEQQPVRQPAPAHHPERERDRDEHLDEERERRERERRRQRPEQDGRDRLGLREAVAEVALDDPRDRGDVAHRQWVVEAVRLTDPLDGRGRGDRAGQRTRRVTRDDLDEEEAGARDEPDGHERRQQPPTDVSDRPVGVVRHAQALPHEVRRCDEHEEEDRREEDEPRVRPVVDEAAPEQAADRRVRLRDAGSQEPERALEEDGPADRERGVRADDREQVREDVAPEDRDRPRALDARRLDVLALPQHDRLPVRDPGDRRPEHRRQAEDQREHATPEDRRDGRGEQQARDRQPEVREAHQDRAGEALAARGREADEDTTEGRDRDRGEGRDRASAARRRGSAQGGRGPSGRSPADSPRYRRRAARRSRSGPRGPRTSGRPR